MTFMFVWDLSLKGEYFIFKELYKEKIVFNKQIKKTWEAGGLVNEIVHVW